MLGQLLADGIGHFTEKRATATGADDTAAKLLKCLCARGPQSIPELIEATGEGLTPVLQALQTVRDFRLVEFVDAGDLVTLTPMGSKTVTVVQKEGIREQAARLLGS
jgi:predicted transcriptional regulator